ncbi:MAG: MFS transporter, partial [Pirellulales bacterium]
MSIPSQPWYRDLTRYHWFVFVVAALGWLFDTMDQQLFNLARRPAMTELIGGGPNHPDIDRYGGYATSIFLVGWATGGIGFGVLGDRIGRAKTMLLTILVYSMFTGLSAFSTTVWDFSIYRFLTGLGVGGEFAVGISLVAEVVSERARPFALGLLQALSAVGNVTAAVISLSLGHLEEIGALDALSLPGIGRVSAWRVMFLVGTLPALLAVFIRRRLKEPERWQATAAQSGAEKKLGSYAELFGNPRWRRNAIVGLLLAFSGVVGLWGIGFFSIDLNRSVFRKTFENEAREQGQAERDRQFVRLAIASPDELPALRSKVEPNQLLSPLPVPVPGSRDAERLLSAALQLADEGRSVSPAAVLDRLDEGNPQAG